MAEGNMQRTTERQTQSWESALSGLERVREVHPYPSVRFYARHPKQEPYAVMPHVRICAGGGYE